MRRHWSENRHKLFCFAFEFVVGLVHPFLCFQLRLEPGNSLSLEFHVTDSKGGRMRLLVSSAFRSRESNPLHAKLPLDHSGVHVPRGSWINLCFHIPGLLAGCGRVSDFQTLDGITVHSVCRIRSVFTLKTAPIAPGAEERYPG